MANKQHISDVFDEMTNKCGCVVFVQGCLLNNWLAIAERERKGEIKKAMQLAVDGQQQMQQMLEDDVLFGHQIGQA